ncbi:methyl-accepting chemotaxis protein [Cystobacter fuscus]|uniref:methyl-accepting chemotaxis protein n=1 Tax=Cystobacter fuscus TaxID=43 RepID=UPI002B2FF363|nr:methyl-accepting chemotaxis protein [Cystobacter fuscus]
MTFKQKASVLPMVATLFLLLILAIVAVVGRNVYRLNARIIQGYSPAIASMRQFDSLASLLRWHLRDQSPEGDAARRTAMLQLAGEFQRELARVQDNPVMEPGRLRMMREAFDAFWEVSQRAGPGDMELVMERHAALVQVLRGAGDWAQAGLERSLEEVSLLHRWRQGWVLSLGLLCVLVLGGLSVWLARGVVEPLTRLTAVTTRIATEGDLSQRIDVNSRDELGELARGIEALVTRLRTVPVTLRSTVDELTWAAGRLTEASQRQVTFLGHLSNSLAEVEEMTRQIAQTASQAAGRAEVVLKVAGQADQFSALGRGSIETSARGLQQLSTRVEEMMRSVANLSEQAARAGEIIGSVRDLADQSNVLALNASIEAARAGEEGRGFAVVAREMRALSGQSLQSTQRIGKILLEINQAIRNAVSIAEQDSQQVDAGISQVMTSAERLKEITTVVNESGKAARQIVASVKQQNVGLEQLHQVIATLTDRMSAVSESTRDAKEAVGQVNQSLDKLKQVAARFHD